MNYLKAALAGFGMSFIGTALCSAKVGTYHECGYEGMIRSKCYLNMLDINKDKDVTVNYWELKNITTEYKLKIEDSGFQWQNFKYQQYVKDRNLFNGNYWYDPDLSKWSVTKAFLHNNAICIPIALLGALFHDKVGRDLTPKINSYFDSEISPYLVTGGAFGILGTVGIAADTLSKDHYVLNDPTQPWIYSWSIIQGFVIGATAMAGAYFGDEKSLDNSIELESEDDIDII